jgi:hypothetical protein
MAGFKPGATFTCIVTLTVFVDDVAVADLTGWTFRSQLRTRAGTLVEELACTLVSGPLRKVRLASAGTAGWPERTTLRGDIIATDPTGTVDVPTGTFELPTDEMVTRD